MELPAAKSWIEIDGQALRHNIATLSALLAPPTVFCAVVKANAYGHGLREIVSLAAAAGVKYFGVDSIDEAVTISQTAPDANVIILGYTVPERYEDVVRRGLIQTVYDKASVAHLFEIARDRHSVAKVNLKIETGTNRQGIEGRALRDVLSELRRASEYVELVGVSTHFANAEDADRPTDARDQMHRFAEALEVIHDAGFTPPIIHMACSAAGILYPEAHFTLARFGISLYGMWSSESVRRQGRIGRSTMELKPVLSLKTRIAQVKDVASGVTVGYARGFVSDRPMRIAVLPIGYYDGFRRAYGPGGSVLIRGQVCRVVGIVCMNMLMVDVSAVANASAGDVVTIIGRDGMHTISADDIATRASTISYEVVTGLGAHLPRIVV